MRTTTPVSIRKATGGEGWMDQPVFDRCYRESIDDPEGFWAEQGRCLDWFQPYSLVRDVHFGPGDVRIRWFHDGTLNAAYNCLDRHLERLADKTAIIWESDEPGHSVRKSYRELHADVCRLANALISLGVGRGDRVVIYLPMIPEAVVSMLACARIGAIHSVVFAGFSADSLANRIRDCSPRVLITADEGVRGGRRIPLKSNADEALYAAPDVPHCIVVERTGKAVKWHAGRDIRYRELVETQSDQCPAVAMGAEDPLFILYTSGSTGAPKGVLHTTGGYLVACATSHKYVLDHQNDDVYWCTADVGWITGHSYIVYGPLANGATTILFEGTPTYPNPSRFWEICDTHRVSIFYTAPTAIRALMKEGDSHVRRTSRRSLRVLGSVGEPINPEAWRWYQSVVGEGRCPVIDTWWQTETGSIQIAPVPGTCEPKPGAAMKPFFGVDPVIVDNEGRELDGACSGLLCLRDAGPGMMRTVYGDHERFVRTYFSRFPGLYLTGDGCRRDEDGDYWITGRVDDVINVAGHRLATAELESALVLHEAVAEAAVVGFPHEIKGQGIYAFVTLRNTHAPTDALRDQLARHVRNEIGPIASPDVIQWAAALPKTRSGKIMRRILRNIAANRMDELGDLSTLTDPSVVDALVESRPSR